MPTTTKQPLPRTTPEQQGIASSALLQWIDALDQRIDELHSVMLLRHGTVVAEGWWNPYQREYSHISFSLSKSFTSTAVGLAIGEGLFTIDDPVVSFFPEHVPAIGSDLLAALRVRHLLSMSTGHEDDTWGYMIPRTDGNWIKAFFEVPLRHEPGTHFLYNTGAAYMLAAIVQKTSGMKLIDYLQPRLFEPLSITGITWDESPQGIALGGIGLHCKTEDIARFGQLYLQKGLWQGQRILSEAWVAEATSAQVAQPSGLDNDWSQGYGYQFWRCRHNAYRGDGLYGQYCVIMPEQDVVLAITGATDDMQTVLDIVWDSLLPALRDDPLPEDTVTYAALSQKLAGLSKPPIQGQATSTLAQLVSNRTYRVDNNALDIETIALSFNDLGCAITLKTNTIEEIIPCGYDRWQSGQTDLFNDDWLAGHTAILSSGAWTTEDTYTICLRFYETTFYYIMVICFDDDELLIEARINLSLDPIKPILLTAKAI